MTLAPRVQVYTQLSCNAVYGHDGYNHTVHDRSSPVLSASPTYNAHAPFYLSLDPAGPHLDHRSFNVSDIGAASRSRSRNVVFVNEDDSNNDEPDPRAEPSKRCLSDPEVQAGAARIQTMMTTVMGTLSAVTTGWWGHFGEQHGRTRVLAAATLGLLLTCVHPCVSAAPSKQLTRR